ncbi:MAG: SPASM domain-containing protein [Gemmatimonadota bacterium]|nr:SPASM domain-containing protein [Gemmatimonadota bacterium]
MRQLKTSHYSRPIVFHVQTGLFYSLDPLCEAILERCDGRLYEDIVFELMGEYEREEVAEAIKVLAEADLITEASLQQIPTSLDKGNNPPESVAGQGSFHITLHVAHTCNMNCLYCFAHGGDYGRPAGVMPPDIARQAVRWALREAKPLRKCQIDFFGGEPLLNFGLIREIVPYAREFADLVGVEVYFGIATNGTVLSAEIIEFLTDEKIQVQVSLDGNGTDQNRIRKFRDGSDTYDVVAENLKIFTDRSPDRVSVHATMTSFNLDRKSIQDSLKHVGACNVEVAPVVAAPQQPYALREEHLPAIKQRLYELSRYEAERILKGSHERGFFDGYMERLMTRAKACHGCQGGKTFMAVDIDGDIYFCSSLADRPEFKIGDVFSGLDSVVRKKLDDLFHVDSRSDCRSCWARNLCGGGCLYDARTATGEPAKPNPVSCEQIRYSYELAMEMCLEIQGRDETLLEDRFNLRWVDVAHDN